MSTQVQEAAFSIKDEVIVYDRFRFAIPLRGIIEKFSRANGDAVDVCLSESNNTLMPIGSHIWVDVKQLRPYIKPKQQVVDLSVLIASKIDCEFWSHDLMYEGRKSVGPLTSINNSGTPFLCMETHYEYCRPRMNHTHAWIGRGICPLPEGLKIKLYFKDSSKDGIYSDYITLDCGDIIAFEVLGLADGWCWPWDKGNE